MSDTPLHVTAAAEGHMVQLNAGLDEMVSIVARKLAPPGATPPSIVGKMVHDMLDFARENPEFALAMMPTTRQTKTTAQQGVK